MTTITFETKKTHTAEIDAITSLAIITWHKMQLAQKRADRLEEEHLHWALQVPEKDMEHFVRATTEE